MGRASTGNSQGVFETPIMPQILDITEESFDLIVVPYQHEKAIVVFSTDDNSDVGFYPSFVIRFS